MKVVDDVRILDVQSYPDKQGLLVAFTGSNDFCMEIERVFVVTGHADSVRGKHAHKELTQIMVCLHGACLVVCDDGSKSSEFVLDQPYRALIVPPGIWAEQRYQKNGATLMVLCDRPYNEDDYLRDYSAFLRFRVENSRVE